jgi:hypothetical protein
MTRTSSLNAALNTGDGMNNKEPAREDRESGPTTANRPRVALGIRALPFPRIPDSPVLDCLRRLSRRQQPDRVAAVAGTLLWLPRLGVTVLPHEPVTEGWVCSLVGTDRAAGWLPVGVFVVSDLEISTAIATTSPWQPVAGMSGAEYGDAWRVRLAAHGGSPMLGDALLDHADPATLIVATTDPLPRSRSGCRTVAGFRQACRRLCDAGLLTALSADGPDHDSTQAAVEQSCVDHGVDRSDADPGAAAEGGRHLLTLPPSTWPPSTWPLR